MKYLLANLSANLVSLACVGAAIYLAAHSKEGWGWFLFVAVITEGCVTYRKTNNKDS
jgi:hypothetical protein